MPVHNRGRLLSGLLLFMGALSGPAAAPAAAQTYDLLLKGGHVLDAKNNISRVLDVAIAGGKIARVAPNIPAGDARDRKSVE